MARLPISVVISARNAGDQVGASLSSVLGALGPDDEVIAIDDGSRDETYSSMCSVLAGSPHQVLRTPGIGLTAALGLGMRTARGDLVARLDAGDTMTSDRLELQREAFLRDDTLVACGGNVRFVTEDGAVLGTSRFPTRDLSIRACFLVLSSSFVHSALCLRRAAAESVGSYREGFTYAQDFDLLLRLSRVGRLINLRNVVGDYLVSSKGISATRSAEQYAFAKTAWKAHLRSLAGFSDPDVRHQPLGRLQTFRIRTLRKLREGAVLARRERHLARANILDLAVRCCTPLKSTVGAAVRGCELVLDAAIDPGAR